jgi:hypothetical protein
VTSNGGVILVRELDGCLGLSALVQAALDRFAPLQERPFDRWPNCCGSRSRAGGLENLWRRLVLPTRVAAWSLTSSQQRLVKTDGRLIRHAQLLVAIGREPSDAAAARGHAAEGRGLAHASGIRRVCGVDQFPMTALVWRRKCLQMRSCDFIGIRDHRLALE